MPDGERMGRKIGDLKMINGYLCEECFKKKRGITQEQFNRAIREYRLPRWEYAQSGRKPVCGNCGKEEVVYG